MRGSQIVGLGHHLPDRIVTSDEVASRLGLDGPWIHARTGIRTRHVAAPDETVVDLATYASRRALAAAPEEARSPEAVIVATSTGERMPSTASQVADRLGLHAAAFDVNAACAGFCQALAVATGLIAAGTAETVLVVGADIASRTLDPVDRNTAPLFGDGAGAAVVTRSATAGIGPVHWGSAGEHGDLVTLDGGGLIRQQGQAVFRWAIGLGSHLRAACKLAGVKPADVAAFIPHQANLRIIDALAATLDAPGMRVARDVVEVGNTMAASVPMALSRMAERGELPPHRPTLLFGFGSGLSWAGQIIHLDRAL